MKYNCCFKFFYDKPDGSLIKQEILEEEFTEKKLQKDEKTNYNLMTIMQNPLMAEITEVRTPLKEEPKKQEFLKIEDLDLEKYLPDEKIDELINFYKINYQQGAKKDFNNLGNHQYKLPGVKEIDIYAKFTKKEDSNNNLHSVFCEIKWNYKIDPIIFYDCNRKDTCNDKVDAFSILNVKKSKNGIVRYLKYSKSKKVLIIQPRHNLDIFAIKKFDDGSLFEISVCVTKTPLADEKCIKDILKDIDPDCLVSNILGVNHYVQKEDHTHHVFFKLSDPKTSVGFTLLKNMIKNASIGFYRDFSQLMDKFYEKVKNKEIDIFDDSQYPFFEDWKKGITEETFQTRIG
jgi:hypothetical protein